MYIEASDHACPHLRETRPAETTRIAVAPQPSAGCPMSATRSPAEPLRPVLATGSAGGWWAFCAQASSIEARA